MDDVEVCQLDLIKISSLIMEAELEGDSPPPRGELADSTQAKGASGGKKIKNNNQFPPG